MLMGSSMGCSSQSRDVSARESSISKSAEQKATPDTLTFAFVGDIMMGTTFPSRMLPADDGKHLFRDAKDILQRADIAAGNLEGTLCDGGQTKKKVSNICYAFRTPTSYSHLLNINQIHFPLFLIQSTQETNGFVGHVIVIMVAI